MSFLELALKMEKTKLFSIITPVYNSEQYIENSILSILSQTYPKWELLIVDDCSSDKSAIIVQKYIQQDNRIKYFKTDKPSGSPILPRNIGIENAKGRYIAFLDSDDVWLPNKLEIQLRMFEQYEDMAICFSDYEKITEEGARSNRIVKSPAITTYKQLLLSNVIGCLTAVYDTQKVGKVFFKNHSHEDYILWLEILKQGFVARNTNSIEALYRVRENSVSSNKLKALSWQWDIYREVEKIGLLRSCYYFMNYAYRAYKKSRI